MPLSPPQVIKQSGAIEVPGLCYRSMPSLVTSAVDQMIINERQEGQRGREAQNLWRVHVANLHLKEGGTDILITAYEPIVITVHWMAIEDVFCGNLIKILLARSWISGWGWLMRVVLFPPPTVVKDVKSGILLVEFSADHLFFCFHHFYSALLFIWGHSVKVQKPHFPSFPVVFLGELYRWFPGLGFYSSPSAGRCTGDLCFFLVLSLSTINDSSILTLGTSCVPGESMLVTLLKESDA
ncbi:hypothetical protein Nepgr_003550 [Nepenthes gracilis]|uniref:Uncharacterized protein n=1 Tax=Nepenthes gracilis TaxID=150966 RepID=A0AAD3XE31_NEPGR|nr:hypothetical protein Nepgr_003550 [Nepenthes gracilis]